LINSLKVKEGKEFMQVQSKNLADLVKHHHLKIRWQNEVSLETNQLILNWFLFFMMAAILSRGSVNVTQYRKDTIQAPSSLVPIGLMVSEEKSFNMFFTKLIDWLVFFRIKRAIFIQSVLPNKFALLFSYGY
jgi:hypothetical protein